jgi:hypothetical protein
VYGRADFTGVKCARDQPHESAWPLSNPLRGRACAGKRRDTNVKVRLIGQNGRPVAAGTPGEIEVRGSSVLRLHLIDPDLRLLLCMTRNGQVITIPFRHEQSSLGPETGGDFAH